MKKLLLLVTIIICSLSYKSFAQAHVPGPVEKRMTDSICSCVSKMDLSKITNKDEATKAYTACILKHADILADLAAERNVELSDTKAMTLIGEDIAFTLLKQDCKGFKELAMQLGGSGTTSSSDEDRSGTASGNLKRIENKGFNYFVITENGNNEKSFIWLKQFPESERFMGDVAKYIGKKITIKYIEQEVYLPQAKGYYKIKEITSVSVL